jgi:hypothetical protein
LTEAAACANQALALARDRGERGVEAMARRLTAEVAARGGTDPNGAEEEYGRALSLAEELNMRPLVAQCRLGLGRYALRVGRTDQAGTEIAAARDLFLELGMTSWAKLANV